jgi:exopolysaccharide biosynthesis protein
MKLFKILIIFILLAVGIFQPFSSGQANMGKNLAGRILLSVEENGEAWYVYPEDIKRYYLGRPHDAFAIMRELGLGITEADFQRIASAGTAAVGDEALAKRLSGRIILQVEKNGEAWYIYPKDLKKYYLGRPADAFRIMRELGLGITRENLALIHKPSLAESIDDYSSYEHKIIETASGNFKADIVKIDLSDPDLKIFTETSNQSNCSKECGAKSLGAYVTKHKGFAGINGTYFDTGSRPNYYFFPVYDTSAGVMVNEDQLKYWTTGPIMAFDENNKFYYFKDSREFPVKGWSTSSGKSVAEAFKEAYGANLAAAIGNKPRLIEDKMNILIEWDIDNKQRYERSIRNAIGYKDGFVYLIVARNTTVPELADIAQAMDIDYALNLDGGYSAALWYNGEYMVGPGRKLPNAVVFGKR